MNECIFSKDRKYRYLLIHRWESHMPERPCMWIALNPSIANESQLDNTLTRIRVLSRAAGFNAFYMTNLFGLVSTDRRALQSHPEPIGKNNDDHIRRIADRIPTVFVAWGTHGQQQNRDRKVIQLLAQVGRRELRCFGINKDGSPTHPLYLPAKLKPIIYRPGRPERFAPEKNHARNTASRSFKGRPTGPKDPGLTGASTTIIHERS
jgi:hypothetical protein